MKRVLLTAFALACAVAAFASTPNVKSMYGWQLEMEFIRLGEGPIGKPILIACEPRMVKTPADCLPNGLFLSAKECVAASKGKPGMKHIDQLYSKPPAGANDWYASVYTCVHEVGPSWAS